MNIATPLRPAVEQDDDARIDELVAAHLATLALIPQITDFPFTVARAERLAGRVRGYGRTRVRALGMLGPNGIAPEIESLVKSAQFHGKPWGQSREERS